MTSTRKFHQARRIVKNVGESTIMIVLIVLAIIALCLFIFTRVGR